MIGVISKPGQEGVVEEFFELFKTPWEFFQPNRTYDVVLATADIPPLNTRLLVVYGAETKSCDDAIGMTARSDSQGGVMTSGRWSVPIYGRLATFPEYSTGTPCATVNDCAAGVRIRTVERPVIRLGYDVLEEVRILLTSGQPLEHAHIPVLDLHIDMLRSWILGAGISIVEIPSAPAGNGFAVCLTHDIDFVGIRNHKFDHSMWGFLYRSTVGAAVNVCRRRISVVRLLAIWRAALSLPLVYLGWMKDFWEPFSWYLRVEDGLPATYFMIPVKRRSGEHVTGPGASRRAAAYDVNDVRDSVATLLGAGCEVGVHGIDAWHSVEKGRVERAKVEAVTRESQTGVRMHWLLHRPETPSVLDEAGYVYDSTSGYNETVGYRNGTTQVFRPLGVKTLLELPLHIQDGALFYPKRLDLSEAEAERRCVEMIDIARQFGGVLTVLWHDRSHGPERFWGDFYVKLVHELTTCDAWFGTAAQVVGWFRQRRNVRFERVGGSSSRISIRYEDAGIEPPLVVRFHVASGDHGSSTPVVLDAPWNGRTIVELDASVGAVTGVATRLSAIA